MKNTKNVEYLYYYDANKLVYSFENNKILNRYTYDFERMNLEVSIFDKNNIEIENYFYDVYNDKIISCFTGSCNNYNEVMNLLNENILDYLYER